MLVLSGLSEGPGAGAFNVSGGTLRAGTTFSTSAAIALTPAGGTATIDTAGCTITLSGAVSGTGNLVEADSGTLLLAATNTYAGDTTINAGTLRLGSKSALPYGPGAGNLSVGGTLDLNNFSISLDGLLGSGLVTSGSAGSPALTVGCDNATSTFSGTIQNGSATALALVKTGSGELVLSGNNSFTGGTTVLQGRLLLTGQDARCRRHGLDRGQHRAIHRQRGRRQPAAGRRRGGPGAAHARLAGRGRRCCCFTASGAVGFSVTDQGFRHDKHVLREAGNCH